MGINFNADSRAVKFDNWTNSEENYNKAVNGEKVEDFQIFDFNPSSYSKDIKEFAQEYIDLYDTDGDGKWDKDEFTRMSLGGAEIPEGMEDQFNELFSKLFDALNLDDDKDSINAGEFASALFIADADAETGDPDGKINYNDYSNLGALTQDDNIQGVRKDFYDYFYGQ